MLERDKFLRELKKKRIAILKGGWSREREISLKTGAAVENSFKRLGIKTLGIDIKRNISDVLSKKKINFCFLALHGPFGEDGRIQSLLEILDIPYTGTGALASAIAMDKNISKQLFQQHSVPTAPWTVIKKSEMASSASSYTKAQNLFLEGPVFVKPVDQGSAIGVSRVDKYVDLKSALKTCFKVSSAALVERFIPGRELTVGVLGKHILPVIEIIPQHAFYDFHSKYAKGGSRHITPADISSSLTVRTQKIAAQAFNALGCDVYGRVDLILTPQDELFVLEVNTIPGMTTTSLLPEAAKFEGLDFDELVIQIVELSLKKNAVKI